MTNAYDKITEQMIAMLDEGVAPWRRPWTALGIAPKSLSTGRAYRGINHLMLAFTADVKGYHSPHWGTYRQIAALDGQVRRGEKSTSVVLWTQIEDRRAKTTEGEETPSRWIVKAFNVFNAEQAEWPEGKQPEVPEVAERDEFDIVGDAEAIVQRYIDHNPSGPSLTYGGDRAYYRPSADAIRVPERSQFDGAAEFYSTLFHEFGHSTGHESRLAREGLMESHAFGDAVYSREELVAEFTATFLCGEVGLLPHSMDNSAAYIAGWRRALTDDSRAVVWAAGKAQKAADLILGRTNEGSE